MLDDAALALVLPRWLGSWGLAGATVEPLGGGMNSATALVLSGERRYVAKWVPHDRRAALEDGARLAARLTVAGLMTGPPLATGAGELVLPLAGGWCTVGAFVAGEPLDGGSDDDQLRMARTLAQAHAVTLGERGGGRFFAWVTPDLPELGLEPWLRPAVTAALAAYDALPPLTAAWLHTDPAPEAFLAHPGAEGTGLIDWTGAEVGPVLYDVASAVMYLGGPAGAATFLSAYADAGVLDAAEWAHLDVLRRFRWAVQAAYFAARLAGRDLTGTDDAGNAKGLADARRGLAAWT